MVVAQDRAVASLLAPDEPAPFEIIETDSDRPLVLACDHASNRIPRSLGDLGLDRAMLEEHIAWDISAGAITRLLSERLGATAVLGGYSRLVVDLNRDLKDSTAFPPISDGVLIEANLNLSDEEKSERARFLFRPYHEAIRQVIAARTTATQQPAVVCIHSFTPNFHGVMRPWQMGILWDKDPRVALGLIPALRERDILVGDNEPYSGRHPADYTVDHHAESSGLAYASIEIRQDLVIDDSGRRLWTDKLAGALEYVLQDARLYEPVGA
ncbi:MAG: N-formylglutamate amidohydrolase [Candidatus Rariloculaceae bacterium]